MVRKKFHIRASLDAPTPSRLPTRDRPLRHTQLPSRYSDAVVQLPQPRQQFNEGVLPEHVRSEYTDVVEQLRGRISGRLEDNEQAYLRTSVNNAWLKLDKYYTLLGESTLYTASAILHPRYGIRWLESNWTSPSQLQWLRDAKQGIKAYLDRWYPGAAANDSISDSSSGRGSSPMSLSTLPEPDILQTVHELQSATAIVYRQ